MKKITLIILIYFILPQFILANSNNITFTEKEKKWIKNHSVIKVGGEKDWAPFDFIDINGNYTGIR